MADSPRETGLLGGPEKRSIALVPYREDWPVRFETLRGAIAAALGPVAVRIEHIGSTAVPGLAAKPILDLLLIVPDAADEDRYLPPLQALGYQLRVREPDFEEHRMLRTPQKDVHLHVLPSGSPEALRYLAFRDALRRDDVARREYQALKQRLAAQEWDDMNAYAAAKGDFIERIIASAR